MTWAVSTGLWAAIEPGAVRGDAVTVNLQPATLDTAASVVVDAEGRITVVWEAAGNGPNTQIHLRQFGPDGRALSAPVQVSQFGNGDHRRPRSGIDAQGRIVVVWHGVNGATGNDIFLRRYSRAGVALMPQTLVNPDDEGPQQAAAVGVNAEGAFTVAWQGFVGGDAVNDVFYRRYSASAVPQGDVARANSVVAGSQENVTVAVDGLGNSFVAWTGFGQDEGRTPAVFGRRISANGNIDDEVRLNPVRLDSRRPALVGRVEGGFVAAWLEPQLGHVALRPFSASAVGEALTRFTTAAIGSDPPALALDLRGRVALGWVTADALVLQLEQDDGFAEIVDANPQRLPTLAVDPDGDLATVTTQGSNLILTRRVGPENIDLAAALSATPNPLQPGGTVELTASLAHRNDSVSPSGIAALDAAIGRVEAATLTLNLPAALENLQQVADTGLDCTDDGGTVRCALTAPLFPGQVRSLRVVATVPATPVELPLQATAEADTVDRLLANNETSLTVAVRPPTAGFASAARTVSEGAGTLSLDIAIRPAPANAFTLGFETGGTAVLNRDYLLDNPNSITVPTGASSVRLDISLIDDNFFNDDRILTLTLLPGNDHALDAITTTAVTITDNDSPPEVGFTSTATLRVTEGQGVLSVPVALTASSSQIVTVPVTLEGPGAVRLLLSTPSISFAPGATTGTISVSVPDDDLFQPLQNATLRLGVPDNATPGGVITRALEVIDRLPPPSLRFDPATGQLSEADGPFTFNIVQSAVSGSNTRVTLVTGGSATPTLDYRLSATEVTIPAGSLQASITVTPVADNLAEPEETLTLSFNLAENAQISSNESLRLTLRDATVPVITFANPSLAGTEGGVSVNVDVLLSSPATSPVTVPFIFAGTASPQNDVVRTPPLLTLPVGATAGRVSFQALTDGLFEGEETLRIAFGNVTGASTGSPAETVLRLFDADSAPQIRFAASTLALGTLDEGAAMTVRLSGPAAQSFAIPLIPGGSLAGDITVDPAMLIFPPGSVEAIVTLVARSGLSVTDTDTFTLTLPDDAGPVRVNPSRLNVTVVNGSTVDPEEDGDTDPGSGSGLINVGSGRNDGGGGGLGGDLIMALFIALGARRYGANA